MVRWTHAISNAITVAHHPFKLIQPDNDDWPHYFIQSALLKRQCLQINGENLLEIITNYYHWPSSPASRICVKKKAHLPFFHHLCPLFLLVPMFDSTAKTRCNSLFRQLSQEASAAAVSQRSRAPIKESWFFVFYDINLTSNCHIFICKFKNHFQSN